MTPYQQASSGFLGVYTTTNKLRLLKFRLRMPLNNYKVLIAAVAAFPTEDGHYGRDGVS